MAAIDDDDDDLLAALEWSLSDASPGSPADSPAQVCGGPQYSPCAPASPPAAMQKVQECPVRKQVVMGDPPNAEHVHTSVHERTIGFGLVLWPIEVRLCVAGYLPWRELLRYASLCTPWRSLSCEDSLWKAHFRDTWPRFARRQASATCSLTWKPLFFKRWSENRGEDGLEEDWLDFSAAQDMLVATAPRDAQVVPGPTQAELLQQALRRCREALFAHGVVVPAEPDDAHVCGKRCRHHRLAIEGVSDGEVFVCEAGGVLHRCRPGVPCDRAVPSDDDFYLVCPVSGCCVAKPSFEEVEAREVQAREFDPAAPGPNHDWDPELSTSAQVGRWFEQGYGMSEAEARDFFDTSCLDRARTRRGLAEDQAGMNEEQARRFFSKCSSARKSSGGSACD